MTAPYTQQNYADWKRRFPGGSAVAGLLGQAKQAAGIEDAPEQAPPLLAPTPNPQAPDPLQQSNQGLLAQQLSASPMQGEGAPQSLLGNHEHRKGLKGLFSHLLRSDRIATDVDSELTPEQSKQARGSALGNLAGIVFNSESPAAQQARRADEMLARGDRKQARQDLGNTRATEVTRWRGSARCGRRLRRCRLDRSGRSSSLAVRLRL
jgi:hypothetical protein